MTGHTDFSGILGTRAKSPDDDDYKN